MILRVLSTERWDGATEPCETAPMKVGILGSGMVGETLSNGFLKHGHEVMRGSRDPKKLATWQAGAGARAHVGTFEETAKFAELAVLGVEGTAAEEAMALCKGALDGKTVLDTTNPIAEAPPVNGVLQYFHRAERVAARTTAEGFSCRSFREGVFVGGQPRDGQSRLRRDSPFDVHLWQ